LHAPHARTRAHFAEVDVSGLEVGNIALQYVFELAQLIQAVI